MAVRPIRTIGDPVLRAGAQPVTTFDAPGRTELQNLVDDMVETMHDVQGVGLAAPQIGVSLRVFVYDVAGHRGHVINPVLTVGDQPQEGSEGCLSVPGMGHPTPRAQYAKVTGRDVNGEPLEVEGDGLLARCLQHETDHLEGKLYVDRLEGAAKKQAMQAIRNRDYASVVAGVRGERGESLASGRGSSFGGGTV
ncbi:peptide deformylase [Kocuria sp.]|uniref:peptide deformylase n=1 Tax=Kocuria sp. TaxID=1871328 RepID=UPI0026DFA4F2|nr:peptide deformylase [Kocuria sp.]MDO5619816.1 peptide deformylase [Kocuria sp.]